MNKWDVRRTEAAIKAAEAQIAGKSYNYNNALGSIKNQETKWNAWRADLYKKDIDIAKAAGKTREASLLQRDLTNFQTRLEDERKAFDTVQTKQAEYLQALSNVATRNAALTGVSFQEQASASIQASVQSSSKSISKEAQASVQSQASALQSAGASTAQASVYAGAKAAQLAARVEWNEAMATGDKAAQQAAEAAFMSARDAASIAGQAAADAAAQASAAAQAATQAASIAQAAATEVASVAADAAEAAQDATRAAQEATLEALAAIEATPGGTTWDAWRAQAAIEQVKAEMDGRSFDGQFGSSYEEAMAEIDRMENSGSNAVQCSSQEGC